MIIAIHEIILPFLKQNNIFIFTLALLYSLYVVVKLSSAYKKDHDTKLLVGASLVLLIGSDMWARVYAINVRAFFEQFSSILVIIPLVVFLFYTLVEKRREIAEREKRKVRGAFQQYVSASVIEEIMKHPEKLKLGGEKKNVTVFFSDIRGFTSISEKLSPEELVKLLNEYLSAMTDIIMKNGGLVDKYMGDAIMAFWGAPIDDPDHAKKCCEASLEMKEKLTELQKKWTKEGKPPLNMGIGINTGDVVVGNMGSEQRFDYTVMGDNVNLGSRLEGVNKEYGTTIIISQFTYEKIKDHDFVIRELDMIKVKGKNEPIKIYGMAGKKGAVDKEMLKSIEHFNKGLQLYRQRKFKEAVKEFNSAVKINDDPASKMYVERCEAFRKSPPPKDWDGVFVMKHK